jgi:DNA-binding NtrC family response regulator
MPSRLKAVIVAEDEYFIRLLAADALTDRGIEVLEASNAEHAIKLLEIHAQNVGVLFTDIHMNGQMNGLQLAQYVTLRWPWIVFLVTSGLTVPALHELPKGGRYLAKPYDPAHAVKHVRELLGAE